MLSIRLMEAFVPSEHRFPTIVAITTCCWGIASLWATMSSWPWALRGGVLAFVLGLLCTIPAYEPALYFTSQSLVVIFVVRFYRANNEGSISRFSLKALLGLTVCLGLVLGLVTRMEAHSLGAFASLCVTGMAAGAVTILASRLVASTEHRTKRIAVAVVAASLCSIPVERLDGLLLAFPEWDQQPGKPYDPSWLCLLMGTMLGIVLWLWMWQQSKQASSFSIARGVVSRLGLVIWPASSLFPA